MKQLESQIKAQTGGHKNFSCFLGDIRKKKQVNFWIQNNKFDSIIHLAAIVPIKNVNKNRKKAKEVNFLGTKNIINAIKKTVIRWFFFSYKTHVYKSKKKNI